MNLERIHILLLKWRVYDVSEVKLSNGAIRVFNFFC